MYANRWFILFLPLLLFWAGLAAAKASRLTWMIAITFLVFSVTVTMIRATDPMPRDGYPAYTPGGW